MKVYVLCGENCKYEGMTKEQILTAITQAVNEGTIGDIDTGFITTIKTITGTPLKFFVGDQATYDALPDEQKINLYAIITNDTTKEGILKALEELYEFKEYVNNSKMKLNPTELEIVEGYTNRFKVSETGVYLVISYTETGNLHYYSDIISIPKLAKFSRGGHVHSDNSSVEPRAYYKTYVDTLQPIPSNDPNDWYIGFESGYKAYKAFKIMDL